MSQGTLTVSMPHSIPEKADDPHVARKIQFSIGLSHGV